MIGMDMRMRNNLDRLHMLVCLVAEILMFTMPFATLSENI